MQQFLTPRQPRFVVLGCGGGALPAVEGHCEIVAAVDPDWNPLECKRSNRWRGNTTLVRANNNLLECDGERTPGELAGQRMPRFQRPRTRSHHRSRSDGDCADLSTFASSNSRDRVSGEVLPNGALDLITYILSSNELGVIPNWRRCRRQRGEFLLTRDGCLW